MIRRLAVICSILLLLSACSASFEDQWVKGETGRVTRILDGDTLALESGQIVKLVSVEAPRTGSYDRDPDPHGEKSRRIMESLALGREATLYYPGMTTDRYDRALAQVTIKTESGETLWLNEELVRKGACWVRIYADTAAGSEPLWISEIAARSAKSGLWREAPPIASIEQARAADGKFLILRGSLGMSEMQEEDCRVSMMGTELEVDLDAFAGRCPVLPLGEVEIRGWARGGVIYVGSGSNLRPAH